MPLQCVSYEFNSFIPLPKNAVSIIITVIIGNPKVAYYIYYQLNGTLLLVHPIENKP